MKPLDSIHLILFKATTDEPSGLHLEPAGCPTFCGTVDGMSLEAEMRLGTSLVSPAALEKIRSSYRICHSSAL